MKGIIAIEELRLHLRTIEGIEGVGSGGMGTDLFVKDHSGY